MVSSLSSEKVKLNVLVLILSSEEEPWHVVQTEGQDKTFLNSKFPGVKFVRYFGTNSRLSFLAGALIFLKRIQNAAPDLFKNTKLLNFMSGLGRSQAGDKSVRKIPKLISKRHGGPILLENKGIGADSLYLPVPEARPLIGLKTIEAFKYVLKEFDFDYLFRTNTSSLVNPKKLVAYLKNTSKTGVYAGYKMKTETNEDYASGAGILMSRDVISRVCDAEAQWRHGLPDDVALAALIANLSGSSVHLQDLPRSHALTLGQASKLPQEELFEAFHIRCKSESPRESVEIMRNLWDKVQLREMS
jgi:hypothetical protein